MSKTMIQDLFQQEKGHIDYFFKHIDMDKAHQIFELLYNCKGLLIFSGVGKSELVAKKIAFTMTSTGSPALFLSPTNALHGDIGIVTSKDIFIMLSKSGESDELMHLIPYLRNKDVTIISLVSNQTSRLARASDYVLNLPIDSELCPFDLAPTTSAVAQLLVGDVFSVALMNKKNFTLDDYAKNHPSGRIGRRITLKVYDLMLTGDDLPLCGSHVSLMQSLVLLSQKKCGCILIINTENHLEGVFTDGDLRRALEKHSSQALDMSMGELMTKQPRTINEKTLAWEALRFMEERPLQPITVLPVINDAQKVVGLLRMHDIIQSGL